MAALRMNRLSLAALALLSSYPALAEEPDVDIPTAESQEGASHPAVTEEPVANIHILEWDAGTASGVVHDEASAETTTETTAETSHDDVWERIRNGFMIDDDASPNPLVSVHESWFAARPENVLRLAERSRPYLFHIVEELDRRDMPMEIALLPMIESAFIPTALSPAAASGIWQFIPSTGRLYGLKQDTWYDGRRDFTASTQAALDYLGKLYLDFGDWQLALAAYNCGEGCVARAIRKNIQEGLPTNYASLSLPHETRQYVPKLLAIRNLIRDPEQYGIAINALPNQPYFDQVELHTSMDIRSAARLADMSSDEFMALNAAFQRKVIRSDTPVRLLLPVDKTDAFQRNLETGEWDTWKPYRARKGEKPADIARRFGTSLAHLKEHNSLQLKRGKLARAQTILVPVKGRGTGTTDGQASLANPGATRHVVRRGDTLSGIADRYGLSMAAVKAANPRIGKQIKVGQTIHLPLDALVAGESGTIQPANFKTGTRKTARQVKYTVKRGDTLHAIARRFDISLAAIKDLNPAVGKRGTIQAGQTIIVRKP
jgi:membrane-bound lytic murein transglycosylase D